MNCKTYYLTTINYHRIMNVLKKILRHYLYGVLICLVCVFAIILADFIRNHYFCVPEILNLLASVSFGGVGFGLLHYAIVEFKSNDF